MLIELVGVLDTGGPLSAGVPINPRVTLTVPKGTSLTLRVTVVDRAGAVVLLPINSLLWTLKKTPRDTDKVFAKTGPAAAAASCDFSMAPADTKNADPGRYGYDVWFTDAFGARNSVIPLSPFELEFAAANIP
jgi:hypothetical protein